MSRLLEKALEKVGDLPEDQQDAIASQIPDTLAIEEAWQNRFAEKRDVIRRMAREALEEDLKGRDDVRWTTCFDGGCSPACRSIAMYTIHREADATLP